MITTVSAATVRAIAAYAHARAIPVDIPLRDTRYPVDEVLELWSRADAAARDPFIGRHAAGLVPFGAFGVVEHLMLLSTTLQDAVRHLIAHYPLVNQAFMLTLRETRSGSLLELHSRSDSPIPRAYADFVIASIRRRIDLAQGVTDHRVVAQPFAATPALFLHSDCMKARLPLADEELCEALQSVAVQRRPLAPSSAARMVRDVIMTIIGDGTVSLRTVARQCGIGERTLQRQLVEEGTSFRAVIDEWRRSTALDLLRQNITSKAIANRLGFSEVRSFHRAFRRWTGTTPHRFRMSS